MIEAKQIRKREPSAWIGLSVSWRIGWLQTQILSLMWTKGSMAQQIAKNGFCLTGTTRSTMTCFGFAVRAASRWDAAILEMWT